MATRILLADDSAFWREQLRAILEEEPGWTVFQATNGAEAVEKSIWLKPNAIILDMSMPILDGLRAARKLHRVSPTVPVLIITVDKSALLEVQAREAGVLAVFSKMDCLELRKFLKYRVSAMAA
jgi:CheY-like chemotaxis protein